VQHTMKVDDFKTCLKHKVRQVGLALNYSASGYGATEVSYKHVNKFLDLDGWLTVHLSIISV
jgi:hypothetical protein